MANAAESIQWAAMPMPGMGSEMTGPMPLPGWVRIVGGSLFLLVVVVHIRHTIGKQVWTRIWHGAHVLMALGMIAMLLPGPAGAVSGPIGAGVFGLAAVFALGRAAFETRGLLWALTAVELGAMADMLAMPSVVWLSWVLAGWLVLQAAGWASRLLKPVDEAEHHELPLRLSLVIMDLGMAAMLAAMQLGTHSAMHGGMPMPMPM